VEAWKPRRFVSTSKTTWYHNPEECEHSNMKIWHENNEHINQLQANGMEWQHD